MPYVSFGNVVLEVYEYSEHAEESQFVYARQNTIYPPSTTQWMGRELRKISLKAKLHTTLSDPEDTYRELLELAEKGQAQKLIIAEQVKGEYVLDKVRANYVQIGASGKAIALELELELTEFVAKELQKKQVKQQAQKKKKAKKKEEKKETPKAIIRADGVSKR